MTSDRRHPPLGGGGFLAVGEAGQDGVDDRVERESPVDVQFGREPDFGVHNVVGRQIFDFAVYGKLVENLAQNIGDLVISDATLVNPPQFVGGVRESSMGADAGAAFSVKVSQLARLYAAYDGRFRGNLTSHSGTVGAEFRF